MTNPSKNIPPDERLNYLAPRDDAAERNARRFSISSGVAASIGAILVIPAVWLIANLRIGLPPQPLSWAVPLTLTLAALTLIAIAIWRTRQRKYFLRGILIGLGIGVLIQGTCWAGLWLRK